MNFNFVVVGNIVDKDGSFTKFEALIPKIINYNPKLLVVIGSLSLDGSREGLQAALDKLREFHNRFGIPVEVTPGEGELVDGVIPEYYKEFFYEPMAAFRFEGANFISLDTGNKELDSKQLDFLSRQLTTPSFVLSYCPPTVGLWKIDALKSGSEELCSVLAEKSHFVLGTFFSCVRSSGTEKLEDEGLILGTPAFLVGNSGGASYEVGKFGYSKPSPNSALVVMVRGGELNYEFVR